MMTLALSLNLAAAITATFLGQTALAQNYLFAFGDSYTTTGFDINGPQPSGDQPLGNPVWGSSLAPAPGGTWSGGPNYIDFLTTELNSSFTMTYNFAHPGATTDNAICSVSPSIPDFRQQVAGLFAPRYSSQGVEPAPWNSENSVFAIASGINDVISSYQADPAGTRIPAILDSYFLGVQQLFDAGARKFLFMGIPPIDRSPGFLPRGPADSKVMADFVNSLNGQLADRINAFTTSHPVQTSIHDFHAFMTTLLDNPSAHGFQDAVCEGDGGSACFWYAPTNVHTTSFFQQHLAGDVAGKLQVLGI